MIVEDEREDDGDDNQTRNSPENAMVADKDFSSKLNKIKEKFNIQTLDIKKQTRHG